MKNHKLNKRFRMPVLMIYLIFGYVNLYSQEYNFKGFTNCIAVGPSYIHTTSAITIQNELTYSFNKYIACGIEFSFSNGHEEIENLTSQGAKYALIIHETLYTLELNGYLAPVNTRRHILSLGFGIGYNDYINTSISKAYDNQNVYQINDDFYSPGLGYNFVLKYSYIISNKFLVGFKGYVNKFKIYNESIMILIGYKI